MCTNVDIMYNKYYTYTIFVSINIIFIFEKFLKMYDILLDNFLWNKI